MKMMNDTVKYMLEKAEDSLRTALTFSGKESVYVISAISKALIEIDNTLFAERLEKAVKEENFSDIPDVYNIVKTENPDGSVRFDMNVSL